MRFLQIERLAHFRRRHGDTALFRQRGDTIEWLLPAMQAQIESAIVDRQQPGGLQVVESLHCLFRLHMNVRPLLVVGARLEQGYDERTIFGGDLLEAGEVAGIATEEEVVRIPKRRET